MPKIRARERYVEYAGRLVNTGKTTPSDPSFSSLFFSQNESLQNQRYALRYAGMHFYQERRGFPASLWVCANGYCSGQLTKQMIVSIYDLFPVYIDEEHFKCYCIHRRGVDEEIRMGGKLNGPSAQTGGSVGVLVYDVPIYGGGDVMCIPDFKEQTAYFGFTGNAGVGTPGSEGHLECSRTGTLFGGPFYFFNFARSVYQEIMEW